MLGIVRAPLLTTLMQVASRFLLVWGIAEAGTAALTWRIQKMANASTAPGRMSAW